MPCVVTWMLDKVLKYQARNDLTQWLESVTSVDDTFTSLLTSYPRVGCKNCHTAQNKDMIHIITFNFLFVKQ
jgi:protein-arginine kinase activator protein McsA